MIARDILTTIEGLMQKTLEKVKSDFATLRTGRASAAILENVRVEYYGTMTPLNQVANIAAPEARTGNSSLGQVGRPSRREGDSKIGPGDYPKQ